jgi:hypothetical protein
MDEQRLFLVLDVELRDVKARHAAALSAFQSSCPHVDVLEVPPRDGWHTTHPPMRVCVTCGYAEHGWYCGYGQLAIKGELLHVSEARFNELRRGPVHQWTPGQPHRNDGSARWTNSA